MMLMLRIAIVVILAIVVVAIGVPMLDLATGAGSLDDYLDRVRAAGYTVYAQGEDNLQVIYETSSQPTLTLNSSAGMLSVRDGNPALVGGLLEVQNNAGNTTYFSVSSSNITATMPLNAEGIGDGQLSSYDLNVGDIDSYGMIRFGDAAIGRTSYNVANVDLDGAVIFRNLGGPITGQIEFLWEEGSGATRFAIPSSGIGNATYNPRSMLLAGPAPADTDMVTVGYWQTNNSIFHNLVADTAGDGADLGVQNDLEVEGDIFTDRIEESTPGSGITVTGDIYSVAWANYGATSTVVGFSGTPATDIWYKRLGNLVVVNFNIQGTSNSTAFTFTVPYTQEVTGIGVRAAVYAIDNASDQEGANILLSGNSTVVTVFSNWSGAVWTSSGSKRAEGQFWYEAQ